jgi:hypothetical protein
MALNEDWTNLAENAHIFERRANWARTGDQREAGTILTIIVTLITAALPIFLLFHAFDGFREDNWTTGFTYLAGFALTVSIFKLLLIVVSNLVHIGIVIGLLWWVGSCIQDSVEAKIERERNPPPTVVSDPYWDNPFIDRPTLTEAEKEMGYTVKIEPGNRILYVKEEDKGN